MFNNRCVTITILLGLFLLSIGVVFGQPPIITPKSNIVLKLDGSGNYTVVLSDVATVTSAVTANPYVTLSPTSFDCSKLGHQTVTVTANNTHTASFNLPYGITIDPSGNLYVTQNDGAIRKISNSGIVSTIVQKGQSVTLLSSEGIVVAPNGDLYTVGAAAVSKITPAGVVSIFSGQPFSTDYTGVEGYYAGYSLPTGLAIDQSGTIYVSDAGTQRIRKIAPDGYVTNFVGGAAIGFADGQGISALFSRPYGLATDKQGNIYVADIDNQRIRKITPGGKVTTLAGNGSTGSLDGPGATATFNNPVALTVDAAGNVYVIDASNQKVRKITPAGFVTTLAGNGTIGSQDGSGLQASFHYPSGITIDATGNLYVTDSGNNKIRKILPDGTVSTYAGTGELSDEDGTIILPANGNSESTLQVPVTVITTPTFNPMPDVTLQADANCQAKLPDYTITAKVSPCSNMLKIAQTPVAGTFVDNASPQVIKLTAEDGFGGIGSVLFNVKVVSKPVITAKQGPIVLQLDASGKYVAKIADVADVSACETPQIQLSPAVFDCSSIGQQMITVTAGDGQPNSTTTLEIPVIIKSPAESSVPSVKIDPDFYDSCDGTSLIYTATAKDAGINPTYQWKVNGQDAGENTFTFTSSTLKTGDKITCIITSSAACSIATATSNVASLTADPTVTNAVTIQSSAINNIASPNKPVTFTATVAYSNDIAYQWQVNNVNTGSNSPVFITNNLANGDVVTCSVSTFGKCIATLYVTSNTITMIVATPTVIVNTFTPNNDGVNDAWDIPSLAAYANCSVKVFNRYGTTVYDSIGYAKPWDGTYNGKQVPVGVYYYIIDLKDGKSKMSGSVTVLR